VCVGGGAGRPEEATLRGSAVAEISISTYQANTDMEDRHYVQRVAPKAVVLGVLDGHGGWQASEFARTHLPRVLESELKQSSLGDTNAVRAFGHSSVIDAFALMCVCCVGVGVDVGVCASCTQVYSS
jgi:serine/threonine protein phosphatase PrpC